VASELQRRDRSFRITSIPTTGEKQKDGICLDVHRQVLAALSFTSSIAPLDD